MTLCWSIEMISTESQVDPSAPYERIIVYISPGFMEAYRTEEYDLVILF